MTRTDEEPDTDTEDNDEATTTSMFAGARAAMDRDHDTPVRKQAASEPVPGPWSGRTRNRQAHFFSGCRPGAAANLKGHKHATIMVKPVHAAWARQLCNHRVKTIKEQGSPQQASKLLLAKAAMYATLAGLDMKDQALARFKGRREAINMTVKDPARRKEHIERAESAMLACFSGPDTLDAAERRMGATRRIAAAKQREARGGMASMNATGDITNASDTLAASLHRTRAGQHQVFITRREMRRRSEVPIGLAGTSFDPAVARTWPVLPQGHQPPGSALGAL